MESLSVQSVFEHTPKEGVVPKNLLYMFHIDEFISPNIIRIRVSWEYLSGSVLAASVKVPYFWDWMINLMNDSNRNLFTPHSNQHLLSFISLSCLYNEWPQFFFEIGRDVEGTEVLEVLSWRVLGARPQVERSWRNVRKGKVLQHSKNQYTHRSINIEKAVNFSFVSRICIEIRIGVKVQSIR